MATKLEIYNIAMRYLGAKRLHPTNGLTEDRQDRRELDAVYDQSINIVLESGVWYFAIKTVKIEADSGIEPDFGMRYVYPLPSDFKRIKKISPDEYQRIEISDFERENGNIYTDQPVIYLSYVSNAVTHGFDLGKWGAKFAEAVGCDMAYRTGLPITGDRGDRNDLFQLCGKTLSDAKTAEALDERVKPKPSGSWVGARGRNVSAVRIRGGRIGWRG